MKNKKITTRAMLLMISIIPVMLGVAILFSVSLSNLKDNLIESTLARLEVACGDTNCYFGYDWEDWIASGEITESDTEYIDYNKGKNIFTGSQL